MQVKSRMPDFKARPVHFKGIVVCRPTGVCSGRMVGYAAGMKPGCAPLIRKDVRQSLIVKSAGHCVLVSYGVSAVYNGIEEGGIQ